MSKPPVASTAAPRPESSYLRRVALPGGISLEYADRGDPNGVPIVFLHGFTDSWHSYAELMPRLPQQYRAIAPSMRGHGGSDRPADGYRIRDFAADLRVLLGVLGLERAVIVGHSMGSLVALRFAIEFPGCPAGLVLLGAMPTLRGNPEMEAFRDADVAKLADPVDPQFVRAFQQSTLARPASADFFETAVAESLRVPARVWRDALVDHFVEDVSDALGRVAAPTLVLWGDRDTITGLTNQDKLAAGIPGARLRIHRGAGHALHWEDPAGCAGEIVDFVDALALPRSRRAA